jgi:hypothetical protein
MVDAGYAAAGEHCLLHCQVERMWYATCSVAASHMRRFDSAQRTTMWHASKHSGCRTTSRIQGAWEIVRHVPAQCKAGPGGTALQLHP